MSHITTVSGRQVDPREDNPDFSLRDIAHALSRIVRYNGHQQWNWSVAQHSICCAQLVEPKFMREALLHDACEAYLCDVPTPIKRLLPDYQAMEARLERRFRVWADLEMSMPAEVAYADQAMLIAESQVLHPALWREMGSLAPDPQAVDLFNRYAHMGTSHIESIFLRLAEA